MYITYVYPRKHESVYRQQTVVGRYDCATAAVAANIHGIYYIYTHASTSLPLPRSPEHLGVLSFIITFFPSFSVRVVRRTVFYIVTSIGPPLWT